MDNRKIQTTIVKSGCDRPLQEVVVSTAELTCSYQ